MFKKLFIFFITSTFVIAQDLNFEDDNLVTGVVSTQRGIFLVLEEGFLQLKETDDYEKYYRKIYNDTTIVNPNTILESDYNFEIIPFIAKEVEEQQSIDFQVPHKIGLFIKLNKNKKYKLTATAEEIIKKLKKK